MTELIFYSPRVNQWLLWGKMILFLSLIVGATSFWFGFEADWFSKDFELPMFFLTVLVIAWHYKIKTSWDYEKEQINVSFYFNGFGYQEVVIRSQDRTIKHKYWSYKPKSFEADEDLKLSFSRINNEIGGFGLDLRRGERRLRPSHIK